MANLAKYGSYTEEAAAADSAAASQIGGNNFMDLEVGDNVLRILPPKVGQASPFRTTAMHYIDEVAGLDKKVVFACPRIELKQDCPACAEAERLNKSANPLDRDRAYQIGSKLRIYVNVLDRRISDPRLGVKVLSIGKMIHNQLKEIRNNPRKGGDFTDPTEDGFDIVIHREGSGKNDTKYHVAADRSNSPMTDDEDVTMELIDNQLDLNTLVNPVVPEDLLRVWESVGGRRAVASGPRAGAGLMARGRGVQVETRGESVASSSASRDATEIEVEYDDDFNPIVK